MCLSIAIDRPDDVLAEGEHLGFQWVVVNNRVGYRCGYARVPLGHPWHGKSHNDLNVEVHGGLTFAEADVPCDAPGADTDWWLGFDCAHAFDAPDPELARSCSASVPSLSSLNFLIAFAEGDNNCYAVRTQAYVESECRSLCQQASSAA
jgi:hypothetical protein